MVLGASGLVGSKLTNIAVNEGHRVISGYKEHVPKHGEPRHLDLTDSLAVKKVVSQIQPEAIINAAAFTDVDRCEQEPHLASSNNSLAAANLATAARETNAFVVQVSTDYIFDGEKGMYSEVDTPRPINEYGVSKLEGEQAIVGTVKDGSWAIARASVVYGWDRPQRPNAATYVYDRLSRRESVRMLSDQFSSPTLNTNLSKMILEIAERKVPGILHTAGATRLNRYEFAVDLAETFKLDSTLIKPVDSDSLHLNARRPRDSSLSVLKAQQILREKPMPIHVALDNLRLERERFNLDVV